MTSLRPIEQSCYWMARRRARRVVEPLQGSEDADVAIVGGGYTGLWTALFLKELEPRLRVVILEQGLVGHGASGRNAGIIGETIDHSHELAIAHFGLDEARRLARLGRENLEAMETFLRERSIDAGSSARTARRGVDAARCGLFRRASRPPSASARRAGASSQEAQAVASRSILRRLRRRPLDPVRLAEVCARPQSARVRVLEGARRVHNLRAGGGDRCGSGTLSAEKLVLATNAYTHHLRRSLSARFIPLYDYILVSDPLLPAQRQAIGWRSRRGVVDARTFFNYYRLTDDGRILWGASEALITPRGCVLRPLAQATRRSRRLRRHPALGPRSLTADRSRRRRPGALLRRGRRGRLLYGLGYRTRDRVTYRGRYRYTARSSGRALAWRSCGKRFYPPNRCAAPAPRNRCAPPGRRRRPPGYPQGPRMAGSASRLNQRLDFPVSVTDSLRTRGLKSKNRDLTPEFRVSTQDDGDLYRAWRLRSARDRRVGDELERAVTMRAETHGRDSQILVGSYSSEKGIGTCPVSRSPVAMGSKPS
jgi:glycine/D-amino acid oxidase-like deaminating enzyme